MSGVGFEIGVILALILANGAFALSEIAIVSARKIRLQQRASRGDARAAAALQLAREPADFLSTVQVGITLVGVLAGAFGGATLAEPLAAYLGTAPLTSRYAEPVAFGVVVVAITFVSLILGELVPKRLALQRPERIAAAVARPMRLLSVAATPVVRLLSGTTDLVVRLLRSKPADEPPITEEEIKLLLAQGTQAGMFAAAEREIVERVFRFADRRVVSLMTPRTRIAWIDANTVPGAIRQVAATSPYSRLLVGEGSLDDCLGYVRVRDILAAGGECSPVELRALIRQPLQVPEGTLALSLLEQFKRSATHIAVVIDEYGGIEGLVTLNDLFESVVGDMPAGPQPATEAAVRRDDGSWLMAGVTPVEDVKGLLGIDRLVGEERGEFRTLAGFVMRRLGRVPVEGDRFDWGGYRFEVVDMDGRSVDKVLIAATMSPTSVEDA
ncbi:MAG: hemolysin family protein [Acidobacteriota bacterium]